MENQAFDPNLYQNYVPQDAVQQYVNAYGGPYAPSPSAHMPTYYPGPGGLILQSGYEGYLVPQLPPAPIAPGFGDLFRSIMPYPRTLASLFIRTSTYLLGSLGVILFGGAVTTALCTLTPLCTISFAVLPFLGLRDTAKNIQETLSNGITSDRVKRAAELLVSAYDKYQAMQNEIVRADTSKESSSTQVIAGKGH